MESTNVSDMAAGYMRYLDKKSQLLAELYQLTERIFAELEAEQDDQLAHIFKSAEEKRNEIDQLDQEHAEVRKYFKSNSATQCPSINAIKALEDNIHECLKELQVKDDEIIKLINGRRAEIKDNLRKIKEGRRMRNAYDGSYTLGEGIYIDRTK